MSGDVRCEVPAPGEWLPAALLRTESYAMGVYVGADADVRVHGEPNLEFQCFLFQRHDGGWHWRGNFGGSCGEMAHGWTRRPQTWPDGRALVPLGEGYLYPRQAWHGPALRRAEFLVGGIVDGFDLTRTAGVTFVPTRTPLPFVAVISEGPGPMEVTAYDEAGTILDHWMTEAVDEDP